MKKWILSTGENNALEFYDTEQEAKQALEIQVSNELETFDNEYHHHFDDYWIAAIVYDVADQTEQTNFQVRKVK